MKCLLVLALGVFCLFRPVHAELPPVVGQDILVDVEQGDDLYSLARRANLALDHVAFANDLPVQIEAPNDARLRLPLRRILPREHPHTGLLVNLPERGVYYFYEGRCYGFLPVAIGMPGRFQTPVGKFKITSLMLNPTWIPPEWAKEEKAVPPGPDNPLGDRWIGFSAPGIGLHATNAPESVGGAVSHGCLRTYPKLAHQIFPYLAKPMDAWIVYEPVKFGRDEDGRLNIQVFPDVYGKRKPLPELARLAEEPIPLPFLQQLLEDPDGLAKVVLW